MIKVIQNQSFCIIFKTSLILLSITTFVICVLGLSSNAIISGATLLVLVRCAAIDIRCRRIPNKYIILLLLLGLSEMLMFCITGRGIYTDIIDALVGLLLFPAVLLIISFVYEKVFKSEGIGMGDIKAIGAIGFILGWKYQFVFIFLSSLFALITGTILSIRKKNIKTTMPMAPFMLISLILVIFLVGIMGY